MASGDSKPLPAASVKSFGYGEALREPDSDAEPTIVSNLSLYAADIVSGGREEGAD